MIQWRSQEIFARCATLKNIGTTYNAQFLPKNYVNKKIKLQNLTGHQFFLKLAKKAIAFLHFSYTPKANETVHKNETSASLACCF
jgi:hypothetical protein